MNKEKMITNKNWVLLSLMLCGEVIFLLPFVVTRVFRPTFLVVFDLTNFQLGSAFSVYGLVAMLSYLFGGPLADKWPPGKLLGVSLFSTSLAGVWFSFIPSIEVLTLLYGFWGLSTILFFWAAFTKATRLWGGAGQQGRAYGLVDGGRGFIAALFASGSVMLLDLFLPPNTGEADITALSFALSMIIALFSGITFLTAILAWTVIKIDKGAELPQISLSGVRVVVRRPEIWLQAIILLCAYVAYKCTDDFSLFASDVLQFNDVDAAQLATIAFWVRPIAAISAGLLGDRYSYGQLISFCFLIVIVCAIIISCGMLKSGYEVFTLMLFASISIGIFGLRGLYYTLFEESKIPLKYTGSAIGVVSIIGFTPDVFFGPIMGYLLDTFPGSLGHQYLFGLLAIFGCIGLLNTFYYTKITAKIIKT